MSVPVVGDAAWAEGPRRFRTRLRWQELSRPESEGSLKVALLSTFTIDPLVPYLGVALDEAGLAARLQVGPFHRIVQECLSDDSVTARWRPDVLVVFPRLEELWGTRPLPPRLGRGAYREDALQAADVALAAAGRWGARLLFVLPPVPDARPLGLGDDGAADGALATAAAVREDLRRHLAGRPEVTLVDAEAVVRTLGSSRAYNHPMFAVARVPFSEEAFALLGRRIGRAIALARRPERDVLVLEAEGTLWTGTADPGEACRQLQAFLLELREAGVRLAAIGAGLEEGLERPGMCLRREHLAALRPGGASAAMALGEIAAELGISPASMVLLSSRVPSLEEAAAALPGLACVAMPDDPALAIPLLLDAGVLDRPAPAPAEREETAAGNTGASLDDFLASLGLEVSLASMKPEQAGDVAELTGKISEFNLAGVERSPEEILAAAGEGDVRLVYVRDRFGDYGLAGMLGYSVEGDALRVDDFLLNCRILGKTVEYRLLDELAAVARERGLERLRFRFRPGARNHPARSFLEELAAGGDPAPDGSAVFEAGVEAAAEIAARRRPAPAPQEAAPSPAPIPDLARLVAGRHALGRPGRSEWTGRIACELRTARDVVDALRRRKALPGQGTTVETAPGNPVEERLAEIWADLLNVERLGVHDDFFALGGDSILAIQMVSRANQAGLGLLPRHVVRHRTIAELAAVVMPQAAVATDQGPVTGPLPLTPIQRFHFEGPLVEPQHFNQQRLVELRQELDPRLLRRALQALLVHHDALRLRYRRTASGWEQRLDPPSSEPPFTLFDLSALPAERREAAVEEAAAELHTSLDLDQGPLMRAALFRMGAGRPGRFLWILHHTVTDGVSWRILLEDLQTAYGQLARGGEVRLPAKTTSYKAWAERLRDYARSGALDGEVAWWASLPWMDRTPLPVDFPRGDNVESSIRLISVSLEPGETRSLLQDLPGLYGTGISEALLAAVALAVGEWTGGRRIQVDVTSHGREAVFEDVDLSRTVGWFVSAFPLLVELPEEGDGTSPERALKAVRDRMRQVPRHGFHYGLLRYLSEREEVSGPLRAIPASELIFNYLGQFDQLVAESSLFRLLEESRGNIHHPRGVRRYLLLVNGFVLEGRLTLNLTYSENLYRRATVEGLARSILGALRSLLACGGSPAAAVPQEPIETFITVGDS